MPLNISREIYHNAQFEVVNDVLYIRGVIDALAPGEFMTPFFDKLHQAVVSGGTTKLVVDIRDLTYLNSSAIREIVSWIIKQKSLSKDKMYSIHFVCNPEHLWQDSSISTLMYLNQGFISKEQG